ncbi:hypothetical protein LJB86_03545 [Deltaproteobacteria bacterium OttesenSCG-928-M10]|nr:hypothetical protein [Deltaproteobacteria bacterium OttesenSCG-928-M10]
MQIAKPAQVFEIIGAGDGNRTRNRLITNHVLATVTDNHPASFCTRNIFKIS